MTSLRWAELADQPVLRAFLDRMGFVSRPPETWQALDMSAATAWQGDALVGAIPLEPRRLKLGADCHWRCLQQTTVAVAPELRGQGLGGALQDFLADALAERADAATVFREQPESAGYRWYLANGFRLLQRLWIWAGTPAAGEAEPLACRPWRDAAVPLDRIEALRRHLSMAGQGLILPCEDRSLADWLPVHPYAAARRFEIAWQAEPFAYALLGLVDGDRLELLEIGCEAQTSEGLHTLLAGLAPLASQRGVGQVRCILAETDREASEALQKLGFEREFAMDLLAKPLGEGPAQQPDSNDRAHWRHQAIDYV